MQVVKNILKIINNNKLEISIIIYFVLIWFMMLPGFYSHDSFYHLFQSEKHIYDVTTGPLFTLLVDIFWDSGFPTLALFFINTLPIIILFVYFTKKFVKNISQRKYRIMAFIILLIAITSPVVISYNVTLWKDVPYSILLVLLVLYLHENQFKLRTKQNFIVLVTLVTLIILLRINGFLVLIPIAILVISSLKYKIILISTILLVCLISLVIGIKSGLIDTSRFPLFSSYLKLQLVAAYAKNNINSFNIKDKEIISEFVNIDSISNSYNCYAVDYAYFSNETFNGNYFQNENNIKKLNDAFINLTFKNIPTLIGDRFCLMLNTLGFSKIEDSYYLPVQTEGNKEIFGIKLNNEYFTSSLNNYFLKFSERFTKLVSNSTNSLLRLFYWTLFINILIIICCYFFTKDESLKRAVVFMLISFVLLVVINVSRDFRYLYYLHLFTPLLIILSLNRRNVKN